MTTRGLPSSVFPTPSRRSDAGRAPPARVEIWLVDLTRTAPPLFDMETACARLSLPDEARFGQQSDSVLRTERRAAHIALRILLERFLGSSGAKGVRGVAFDLSPSGKPSLAGCDLSFSLSHCTGAALIGIAECAPIGIDIERVRPVRIMGERRAAIERAGIALGANEPLPLDGEARFITAWVRLEAVAKAEGSGVGAHLSVFLGRRAQLDARPGALGGAAASLVARDVVGLGKGLFGAVALPAALPAPSLQHFPTELAHIQAMLGGG